MLIQRNCHLFTLISILVSFTLLTACLPAQERPTFTPILPTISATVKPSATSTPEPATSSTSTPKNTLTPTTTFTPTYSPTYTPVPTYIVLRGIVNQAHVNCYYGPSKAYLYKYGLLKDNRLDIIGFMADTGYIEVQAIGGDNPCWMNLAFMDVQGDIRTVKPVDPLTIKLPWTSNYPGLNFAKAIRSDDEVTITWSPLVLRPGDDSEQEPYLLETWVCRDKKLSFVPIGAYETRATVVDQAGCSEPSFGRVYGVEKHGYTRYLMFEWPQAEG
jgi:hypothetical protein